MSDNMKRQMEKQKKFKEEKQKEAEEEEKRKREQMEQRRNEETKERHRRCDEEEKFEFARRTFPEKISDDLFELNVEINKKALERSMYIYGDVGVGKTMYAVKLALKAKERYYKDNKEFSVGFAFVPNLLAMIKETWNINSIYNETGFKTQGSIFEYYKNKDLLILDDLGAEKESQWVLETLLRLANARDLSERQKREGKIQTIVTSNLSPDELIERSADPDYFTRIVSKIRGAVNNRLVHFESKDQRID